MKRKRPQRVIIRDEEVLSKILKIKGEHPLWGYRRVWSYLKYRLGENINKKRICRVMKENSLLVTKNVRLKAKRTVTRAKPKASRPNQFWGIDMTKITNRTIWVDVFGNSVGLVYEGDNRTLSWNAVKSKRLAKGIK